MFDDNFETVLANTETARRIHYQVRYQVYCLEEGFEDHHNFNDYQEKDDWDEHSVHFLVRSKTTREWVAAMRLVPPTHNGLPLENVCSIDATAAPENLGKSAVEVSRLCILNPYRHARPPAHDASQPASQNRAATGESPVKKLKYRSEIVMGLMRAAAAYCREHNITYWYFLSTPAFARMMNIMNFQLIELGPACEYRGKRKPYLINPQSAHENALRGCSAIARLLAKSVTYRHYSDLGLPATYPQHDQSLVA
jgi:N-acyl amino acid synthase of PEP-CTERM/exosortase system